MVMLLADGDTGVNITVLNPVADAGLAPHSLTSLPEPATVR